MQPLSNDLRERILAAVDGFEAEFIRDALARNAANQTRTATELGLSRRALYDKLVKYGLNKE